MDTLVRGEEGTSNGAALGAGDEECWGSGWDMAGVEGIGVHARHRNLGMVFLKW